MQQNRQISLKDEIYQFIQWNSSQKILCNQVNPLKAENVIVHVPEFQVQHLKNIKLSKNQYFSLKPTMYDQNIKFIQLQPLFTTSPTGFVRENEDVNIFAPTKVQCNFYMFLGSILHEVLQSALQNSEYDIQKMLIQQLQSTYYQFFQYIQTLEQPDVISQFYLNQTVETIVQQLLKTLSLLKQKIDVTKVQDIIIEKHINSSFFRLQGKIDVCISNEKELSIFELKTRVTNLSYRSHATQLMCYVFSLMADDHVATYYDLVGLLNNHNDNTFDMSLFKRLRNQIGYGIFSISLGKDIFNLLVNQRNEAVQYWYFYDQLDFVAQLPYSMRNSKIQQYFDKQKQRYLKQWMHQFIFEKDVYEQNLDCYDQLIITNQVVDTFQELKNHKYVYQLQQSYKDGQYRIAVYNKVTQQMTYTWLFCEIDNGYLILSQQLSSWNDYILIVQLRCICMEFQLYNLANLKQKYYHARVSDDDVISLIKDNYEKNFTITNRVLVVNNTLSSFSSLKVQLDSQQPLYQQLYQQSQDNLQNLLQKKMILCTYKEYSELYNNFIQQNFELHDEDYNKPPILEQITYNPYQVSNNTNIILIDPQVNDNFQERWISALAHYPLFIFTNEEAQHQFIKFWTENISDVNEH